MRFVKLIADATIPTRGTKFSAGYDLYAIKDYKLWPGGRLLMSTGIAWEDVPPNWVGFIKDRSSLAHKHGLSVMGGVIDADYEHEIRVILRNNGDAPVELEAGTRIAQLVILKYEVMGDFVETTRNGGFGSTDK